MPHCVRDDWLIADSLGDLLVDCRNDGVSDGGERCVKNEEKERREKIGVLLLGAKRKEKGKTSK